MKGFAGPPTGFVWGAQEAKKKKQKREIKKYFIIVIENDS